MRAQWVFFFLFCIPMAVGAQFRVPPLTDPVMDLAGMITPGDQRTLRSLILSFHQREKGQIQVLTVPNLGGLPIEQASIQITDQWKLGNKKRDDGVLILVAAQEHQIRIEVGQGLEGVLPDIKAKRIISDLMVPLFRRDSPSQGILIGTFQVMKTIDPSFEAEEGAVLPAGESSEPRGLFGRYEGLFILIFIILMIMSNLFRPRRRSFWGGGGFGGGGWGGGGWGGGSGGGWSGGGGGFSGGGASGNW